MNPAPGAPIGGPLALPVVAIAPGAIGLPAVADVDDISYGNDVLPPPAPFHIAFSVGPGSTGHPGSPPLPPYPNVTFEGPTAGVGDFAVQGDIFSSFILAGAGGPLGAFAPLFAPPPCGPIQSNIQSADENGLPPFAFGAPNVGLGLVDTAPGPPPGLIDNLDQLSLLGPGAVSVGGVPTLPIFFTVSPATAALLPALPPAFGPNSGADVLAWVPGFGLVNWAPAVTLGLTPLDDIDGLEVSYSAMSPPIPAGWGPPASIMFSLAPGSPTNAALGSFCFGPGSGTPADLYVDFAPFGAPPFPAIDAEMLGLNTLRSGGGANDNLDAFDLCGSSGIDADGDLIDNSCDFDRDGDLIGNTIDNCPDASNAAQTNTDAGNAVLNRPGTDGLGDACDTDDDGDGYLDATEIGIAENPLLYCTIMRADVNGDGGVNILDIAAVAMVFGQTIPPAPARRNQDADSIISILDLSRQASVFTQLVGACPP